MDKGSIPRSGTYMKFNNNETFFSKPIGYKSVNASAVVTK